jgi:hypothetical protein
MITIDIHDAPTGTGAASLCGFLMRRREGQSYRWPSGPAWSRSFGVLTVQVAGAYAETRAQRIAITK